MRKTVMVNILSAVWSAWRRRYLIAIPILLLPLAGLAVGVLTPKKYQTHTTVLIQEAAKQNPFLEDLTVATKLKERMDALRALLHSRHILGPVAAQVGLVTRDMPAEEINQAIAGLSQAFHVALAGEDLVKLTYTASDPRDMAEVLGLVSVRFVERIIAPQRSSIADSEKFLSEELKLRLEALSQAERELADYKSRHAEDLPELHANNVKRLRHLEELLSERESALEGARAALTELEQRLAQTNPLVGELEERIIQNVSRLAELRSRYTDKHSRVIAAKRELRSLEQERARLMKQFDPVDGSDMKRLWNLASSTRISADAVSQPLLISQLERLQESKNQVSSLEKEVAKLGADAAGLARRIQGFGEHDRRLTELGREVDVRRKIYEDLAERHQLARVTGALGRAEEKERVKLIDPPFTPTSPIGLPLIAYVVAGLFAGVAFGAGLVLVAEVLDTRIYRRDLLARITGVPILARIPRIAAPDLSGLEPIPGPDRPSPQEEDS